MSKPKFNLTFAALTVCASLTATACGLIIYENQSGRRTKITFEDSDGDEKLFGMNIRMPIRMPVRDASAEPVRDEMLQMPFGKDGK
jgi:hypothetical protein